MPENVFNGGVLHMSRATGECEVHDDPSVGLARKIIELLRKRDDGGVIICVDCLARAKKQIAPHCEEHGHTTTHKISRDDLDYHWFYCSACRWEAKIPKMPGDWENGLKV